MRTLLVIFGLLVVLAAALWFGFPWWYLNTSPRVLMQPKSLIAPSHSVSEGEGMGLKPDEPNLHALSPNDLLQLMYLDQPLETRLAAGFKQMELKLPVLKIGVGTDGDFRVAGVEFWVGEQPSQPVLERETIEIVYTAFRMVPILGEIDLYGVDQPDTRVHRGHQLLSLIVKRDAFVEANPRLSRHQQIAQFGALWLSPTLEQKEPGQKR